MDEPVREQRMTFWLHRLARSRPRLVIALALGGAVGLTLPNEWTAMTRTLAGWNVGVWFYLCAMGWMMLRASHARVRTMSDQQDNSAPVVLTVMSIAAISSLSAIVFVLAGVKELPLHERMLRYGFTASTVGGSWLLVVVMFTFHYAHMFYRAPADERPLEFPDLEQQPNYWDFLYFSFTIAIAAQTSDVSVHGRPMRKAVTAQSLLSFLFNMAIIGLSINIAAGLIAP
ncbi:MAG: DUF1345 domain-containing protein [Burkholderiaceae bacterium]|nr:DUF1345 domain-containing protein [Burkholderiaceae bacterium]